jgi:hypothetical protein
MKSGTIVNIFCHKGPAGKPNSVGALQNATRVAVDSGPAVSRGTPLETAFVTGIAVSSARKKCTRKKRVPRYTRQIELRKRDDKITESEFLGEEIICTQFWLCFGRVYGVGEEDVDSADGWIVGQDRVSRKSERGEGFR